MSFTIICTKVKFKFREHDLLSRADIVSAVMKQRTTKHIDKEQPPTIEEHFKLILEDNTPIDNEYSKITPNDLPDWFEEDLFRKGQEYYSTNYVAMTAAHTSGLIAVFLIPSIAKILTSTKQSSSPCSAFKRYLQTSLHSSNLHDFNVKDADSAFYKSLNTIRWKHSTNSKRSEQCNQAGITQRDMVLTQFGFIGYVLASPEALGIVNEVEAREGYNHLWRVVGHLLGIPDRINVCRKNQHETTLLCEKLRDEVYAKEMKQPTEMFHHLTEMTTEGLRDIEPSIDTDAFLKSFYELHKMNYEKPLSLYSKFLYYYRNFVRFTIGSFYIGWIARPFWNTYLRIMVKMAEKYPIIAWLKYGKNQSKINLYPHPRT